MPSIPSMTTRTSLLLWICTAACSSAASSGRDPELEARAVPAVASLTPSDQDSLLRATFAVGESLGRTRAAAIARLGQPSQTTRRPIGNPHVRGQTDTLISLSYEQMRLTFWVSGAGLTNEVRFDIEILTPWPLDVVVPTTASRAHLIQLWGKPGFVHSLADTVVLNWNAGAYDVEEHLQAYFVRDAIQKLRWSFYID